LNAFISGLPFAKNASTTRRSRAWPSIGTPQVWVFDLVAARTGLRHDEAAQAGFDRGTTDTTADDHKVYYPHARPVRVRLTAGRRDRRLVGVELLGAVPIGVAKRVDTAAARPSTPG